jgi:L-cysteine/cystine lyase
LISGELKGELDLAAHRQQFSSLAGKQYFNYGGQGPMADSALAALAQSQQKIQTEGPFSNGVNQWLQAEGHQLRGVIAQALGTTPETITLTENVTAGCNIPLWGLPWQSGDHILLGDCEHPGVVAAVAELSRRYGLTVSTCALAVNGGDPVAIIEQALTPQTRLVVISHILWNTGQVLPLKEIVARCHANGPQTRVLVDAAQSVGVLPLDAPGWQLPDTGVDYYALTGHKWWCGPAGVGALYIRPEVLATTAPTFIGWRGIQVDGVGHPTGWFPDGRRFEVATSDYSLWVALRQAMAVQSTWDRSAERYGRICQLSERLWSGLQSIPRVACLLSEPPPSGLVSFYLMGADAQPSSDLHLALVAQLENERLYVRSLLSPNCVRACVHYLTLEAEVDALVARVQAFIESA